MIPLVKFKDTEEALAFGRIATLWQRKELLRLRLFYLDKSDEAIAQGNIQESLDAAIEAQFYRESLEAGEEKENHE